MYIDIVVCIMYAYMRVLTTIIIKTILLQQYLGPTIVLL